MTTESDKKLQSANPVRWRRFVRQFARGYFRVELAVKIDRLWVVVSLRCLSFVFTMHISYFHGTYAANSLLGHGSIY